MKKPIFSIYDEKAETFCNPFVHINVATAQRDFLHACQDDQSELGRYPADYTLYHVGEFDESKGINEAFPTPVFVCKGSQARFKTISGASQ